MTEWLLATSLDLQQAVDGTLDETIPLNTMWVVIAAVLVLFMQAGFAMLEIGFSRAKNAGTGVAKILTNLSIAAICYWAVGFAFAFGSADVLGITSISAPTASSCSCPATRPRRLPVMGLSDATIEAKWLFQFAFCAVSLAIVWGSTLERIKYSALRDLRGRVRVDDLPDRLALGVRRRLAAERRTSLMPTGMQDFAGSTAVHLIGATGALAALLLLGPRKGKYGPDGKPRAIPGHSMPLVGLGVLILFFGWFGFNAGSTLGATDARFARGRRGHDPRRRRRRDRRVRDASQIRQRTIDIGMVGNGMIAGLVAITAPSGYVEAWAGPIIGFVAGCDRRARRDRDRQADRRPGRRAVGARPGRHLGHDRVRPVHRAAAGPVQRLRRSRRRPVLLGRAHPAVAQAVGVAVAFAFVFAISYATFAVIKATIGLRVSEEQEDAGLDIVEHGMYGYPEQFIPLPEIGAASSGPAREAIDGGRRRPRPPPPRAGEVTA